MSEPLCPVCRSSETSFFAEASDRLLRITNETFQLRRCKRCDVIFIFSPPSPEQSRQYYPSGYWWQEPQRAQGFLKTLGKHLESLYRRVVLRDHVRFVLQAVNHARAEGQDGILLDVGCSGGTLLYELSRRGAAVRGLDFSEQAVAHAREVYGLDCAVGDLTQSPWPTDRFSVVTAFHVLEHIANPRVFLQAAHAALSERGRLVVQVPNLRSWQFRFFGMRWYGLDVPRHLVNFNDRALTQMLEECGFEVIRRKRFSWRDDPAAWVSSCFPGLDPLARAVRAEHRDDSAASSALGIFENFVYFLLLFVALPMAVCDSVSGRGATVMIEARRQNLIS